MLKDELEVIIASDSVWSGRSTLVLAIGILGEYAVLPFLEEKIHWKRLTKAFFAVLVVAGIVGEYLFSERIARNASELQRLADVELSDTEQQVRNAVKLAGNISDRADKLGALLKIEQETAALFQKQATESEASLRKSTADLMSAEKQLDRDLRMRSPREKLMHDAHISDDPRLAEFRGQHVTLVACLEPNAAQTSPVPGIIDVNPIAQERDDAFLELGNQLQQAGWVSAIGITQCTGSGQRMYVDPRADEGVLRAAHALARVLHDALLLEGDDPRVTVLSQEWPSDVPHDPIHSFEVLVNENVLR